MKTMSTESDDLAEELDVREGIRQGLDDLANGRTRLAQDVFTEIREEFAISRADDKPLSDNQAANRSTSEPDRALRKAE
jgi:hypothetical protein